MNSQPIEKQVKDSGSLSVHSIFYTIQGEGPYAGHPAVFIRLAGCNLQCPGCDTDYTDGRLDMSVPAILRSVRETLPANRQPTLRRIPLVVITGGEPLRQDIASLIRCLSSYGYRVQIETNGTLYVDSIPWDSVTVICSPKTGKIHPKLIPHIDAYKYVMSSRSVGKDGLPLLALDHTASPCVARPPEDNLKPVYLQPMDEKDSLQNNLNQDVCIDSCMTNGYILQLQIHKIIGME